MKALKDLTIPFVGLKDGLHVFKFDIEDSFFDSFENSLVKGGNLQVELRFDKKPNFFILDFVIEGTVKTECDRCLQDTEVEILDEFRMYVKFDDELAGQPAEEDNVLYISWNDTHLDVSQLIYEFIHLAMPSQKFCKPDEKGKPTCDKEMLKRLSENKEEDKEIDPRWAALKNLK